MCCGCFFVIFEDFWYLKSVKIPTLNVFVTVTVMVDSVGSFFDIVVCGGCVVGVFLLLVSPPILQDTRLPRPYYCLEEFQDSNTYCTEGLLSTVTVNFVHCDREFCPP